jgi:hypothetical protein
MCRTSHDNGDDTVFTGAASRRNPSADRVHWTGPLPVGGPGGRSFGLGVRSPLPRGWWQCATSVGFQRSSSLAE